jgi:bifunctional non-homologous end joining protein LigD
MSKAARPGKIFIDYMRNERGATAVVAYSPRARAGAPVSFPLEWKELNKMRAANAVTVSNALARLKKRTRDPWKDLTKVRQAISDAAMQALLNIQPRTLGPSRPRKAAKK